uniref:Uncharacterized protein n=1 Tax=Arundo donax TaxID=35708 RepID=A0A0A9F5C9_ARUDO
MIHHQGRSHSSPKTASQTSSKAARMAAWWRGELSDRYEPRSSSICSTLPMRRSTTISTIELRKSAYGLLDRFTTAMSAPASSSAPITFLPLTGPFSSFLLSLHSLCFVVTTDTSGRKASSSGAGAGSVVLLGNTRRGARRVVVFRRLFLVVLPPPWAW